jgi:hypothetical protein
MAARAANRSAWGRAGPVALSAIPFLLATTALPAPAVGGCEGDTDGSGVVDILDLLQLLSQWGPCPGCAGDVNADGMVGIQDLLVVLAGWGPCPASCLEWQLPWQQVGHIVDLPGGDLAEVSGIDVSTLNPGIIWAHDDSGHPPDLYALRLADGQLAQRYHLLGIANCDWEDMAIGPGPVAGRDYIFVVDDDCNAVVRIPEPIVPATPQATIDVSDYEVFGFQSIIPGSDGEVLLVDPASGTPYFVAFNENVYRFPMPLDSGSVATLELVAGLDPLIGETSFRGGDVSPDGDRIVLRGYLNIYEFVRPSGGSFADMFQQAPCITDADGQGQAEAIAFDVSGDALIAISEWNGSPIWRIEGAR